MDPIFTTIKVKQGTLLFFDKHVKRLARGDWYIEKTLEKLRNEKISKYTGTIAIRIEVLEDGKIAYKKRNLPHNKTLVTAVTIIPQVPLPRYKYVTRTIYENAQKYAEKQHADITLFTRGNVFLESTISNIVSVGTGGELITPPLTIEGLQGITREVLIEKGIMQEKDIPIKTNGPVVLINALRIQGVTKVNGRLLKDPTALMKKIERFLQ